MSEPERHEQPEYDTYLSKATKEAGFTFFGKAFGFLLGFVAQAILARFLGADLLGVYVLAWTVVMAVSILTTFGFEGSFVKYIAMYVGQGRRDQARSVFVLGVRFGLIAGIVGTVAIIAARGTLAHAFFKEPRLEQALALIALGMVPYTLMRLYSAALRAIKDMKHSIMGFEFWFRVSRIIGFLLLFYAGFRLMGVVVAAVAACVISAVVTVFYLRRGGSFLFGRGAVASIPTRSVVSYSAAMLAETTTAFALLHSSRLVLGFFLDSADVGVFNVVALLATLASLFVFSFNAIFSPIIADIYHRGNVDLMKSLLRAITRWIMLLTLPVYAWLLLSGDAVLGIFGREFVRGYAALVALGTAQMLDSTAGSVASCLAMTKYQRYNVYNTLAMAIVSVGLNVLLIPRMGILGAGVATAGSIVLVNIARLVEGKVLLGVVPYDRTTLKVLATGAVLLGVTYAARRFIDLPDEWYWSGGFLIALYGLVAALTLLMGIREEDRIIVGAVLRRLGRRRGTV